MVNYLCDCCDKLFPYQLKKYEGHILCPVCARTALVNCSYCGEHKVYSPYGHSARCTHCVVHDEYGDYPVCDFCNKIKDLLYAGGHRACLDCFDKKKKRCSHCNQLFVGACHIDGDKEYCNFCYMDHFTHCYKCRKIVRKSKVRGFRGEQYCTGCVPTTTYCIKSDSFDKIRSDRCYGIEIECNYTEYLPDDCIWYEKDEHCGVEYVSPLLQGDKGLEIIRDFYCDSEPDFNDACGLHVHVDVRDFTDEQLIDLVKALKTTKHTWLNYVDSSRWNNEYCDGDIPPVYDYDSWNTYFNREGFRRYAWCNLNAIHIHGSVEFRCHEATEDYEKVIKWVAMIVNFVSEVKEMSNV